VYSLARGRVRLGYGQVEQRCVARTPGSEINQRAQIVAPAPRVCRLENQVARRAGWQRDGRQGRSVVNPDDDCLAAAIEEKVAHRKAHSAQQRKSAELALVIGKAIDDGRGIRRSPGRPADECSNRGSDPGYGVNTAWDFPYVYACVSRCACHQESSLSNVAFLALSRPRPSLGWTEQPLDLFEPFGIDPIARTRIYSCSFQHQSPAYQVRKRLLCPLRLVPDPLLQEPPLNNSFDCIF